MKTQKILVVEDERSVRQALRFELEDDGYEVVNASDCSEAINAFHEFGCDMVITDIYLERGDGIELMNKIKNEKNEIPFIVITAFPDSDLSVHAKEMLKDRFYEKPFFMPDLKEKVNELLGHKEPIYAV